MAALLINSRFGQTKAETAGRDSAIPEWPHSGIAQDEINDVDRRRD